MSLYLRLCFFLRYRIVCAVVGHINRVLIPFVIYEMMKK